MIYVIGDSHTRSFAFNDNFIPLFLGQGKEINFTSDENLIKIKQASSNLITHFDDKDFLILFIGEPDTRFYLNAGWYPWDNLELVNTKNHIENIEKSISRYHEYISFIKQKFNDKIFVLNVIPSNRLLQNIIVDEYNKQLKKICDLEQINFLEVNNSIYTDDMHEAIKEEYISDHVHLNNKLQLLVQEKLKDFEIDLPDNFDSSIKWDNSEIQKKFYFDEKFGCYKLKTVNKMKKKNVLDYNEKPSESEIVNFIKNDGVVVITNFCKPNDLTKLKAEYQSILSGTHQNSNWFENRPYSLGVAALLSKKDGMQKEYPATFDFFSQPMMQSITNTYLGDGFHANQKIFVVKDVVGASHHANDLHFDVQRTLKFFLYLTDTNASNGAFRCVPGSHLETKNIRKNNSDKISYENREFSRMLPYGPEDAVSVDGKAGSLIIFDTDVFHQAGKVSVGERWVMRGQTDPVPSTVPKNNQKQQSFFQKLKRKFF
jgi:hypothetical protein